MFTAITIDNLKVEPSYNIIAFCENCGHRLRPKCVTPNKVYLKRKHFFHEKGICCDNWYEPTSEWHYEWQSHVPIEQREVSVDNGQDRHIADILLTLPSPPIVVELQKSNIPYNVKISRDAFYKRVIWLIHEDLQEASWVKLSNTPIFVDLLNETIKTPFNTIIPKQRFIDNVLNNPNLDYDLLLQSNATEEVITRYNNQIKEHSSDGYNILGFVMEDGSITFQCLCNEFKKHILSIPKRYRPDLHTIHVQLETIIKHDNLSLVQCPHCLTVYTPELIRYDPRGDDEERESREIINKNKPFFKSSRRRKWEEYKKSKLPVVT